nr:hypothetical protein [Gemmatimonadaceae bacterium]
FERQGARVARTPWQRDAWRDLVTTERPTHLLLLLGTTQARGRRAAADGRREDYETIDHDLTALAIDAAVASDAAPGLVYLSAIGARLATRSAYLRVRGRIEARLATCGLAWCAVRPAFITGDDRAESRPVERVTAAPSPIAIAR